MGTRWGVQRSMAEVHALLFIVGEPLSAEEIMERLSISRGSVSTTLKQLVEWGLVQRVNTKLRAGTKGDAARGDRREFHQAEQDRLQDCRRVHEFRPGRWRCSLVSPVYGGSWVTCVYVPLGTVLCSLADQTARSECIPNAFMSCLVLLLQNLIADR